MERENAHELKLGPGATILRVPENEELLRKIEEAPTLSPEELLRLAKLYRDHPATQGLAHHLAFQAMARVTRSPRIKKAMNQIGRTEIEWSYFDDLWDVIEDFFDQGDEPEDRGPISPPDLPVCETKCEFSLFTWPIGVLIERCGGEQGDWHIIGVCVGGSF